MDDLASVRSQCVNASEHADGRATALGSILFFLSTTKAMSRFPEGLRFDSGAAMVPVRCERVSRIDGRSPASNAGGYSRST